MSLIANALKAAQQEKDRQERGDAAGERRVRSVVGPAEARGISAPRSRQRGSGLSSPVYIAIGGLALVAGIATWLMLRGAPESPVQSLADRGDAEIAPPPAGPPASGVAFGPEADEPAAGGDATGDLETVARLDASDAGTTTPAGGVAREPGRREPANAVSSVVELPRPAPAENVPEALTRNPPRTLPPAPGATEQRALGAPVESEPRNTFRLSVDVPAEDLSQLLQRAVDAQRRGQPQAAIDLYQRAITIGAGSAEIYNNLGVAYRSINDYARARDAYRHALELDPRDANAWNNLGVVIDALGDREQARAAYQRALETDAAHVGAKVNLARHYHTSRMLDDAKRLLEQAVRTDPLLAEAHYALARVLEDLGDRDGALRHYNNFLSTHAGRFPQEEGRVRARIRLLMQGSR